MNIVKPNTVWQVKRAICGLRKAPRLWQAEGEQQLRDLELKYRDRRVHLVHSHIHHPSWWFIVEGPLAQAHQIPPFDHSLRSDDWTAQLHDHKILKYLGVHVDDLLTADKQTLDFAIKAAIQQVWKTSTPEHLGPETDCVPVLRS